MLCGATTLPDAPQIVVEFFGPHPKRAGIVGGKHPVLKEVTDAASDDKDIKVLLLPPDSHRAINALQRSAVVVLQKSVKEGFGLTVTEALWKGKPVIGGACGGITLQVHDYHTGFLVYSPAGAAYPGGPGHCPVMKASGRISVPPVGRPSGRSR